MFLKNDIFKISLFSNDFAYDNNYANNGLNYNFIVLMGKLSIKMGKRMILRKWAFSSDEFGVSNRMEFDSSLFHSFLSVNVISFHSYAKFLPAWAIDLKIFTKNALEPFLLANILSNIEPIRSIKYETFSSRIVYIVNNVFTPLTKIQYCTWIYDFACIFFVGRLLTCVVLHTKVNSTEHNCANWRNREKNERFLLKENQTFPAIVPV